MPYLCVGPGGTGIVLNEIQAPVLSSALLRAKAMPDAPSAAASLGPSLLARQVRGRKRF